MRTALMEMYGAKKVKREAWVPESILDDDVSHFMGAAAAAKKAGKSHFDFGGKKYKVTMKSDAAKKIGESAECPTCGDGECQCEQPESVEENYTDKQDASYRDEPTPKGAQKRLKALHKKALAYRKKHGVFPSVRKRQKDLAMKKAKSDLKFESVEEAVSVKKKDYSWGRMMTVHHGTSHSYPLHPEHQSAIKKLGDNQKTSFKDETGTKVTAHRQGDTVHLSSSKTSKKTPVAHSHFTESVNEAAGTAQHKPTPETSDTWDKQMNNGEGDIPMGKKKDFVDQHNMEVGLDAEKIYQQNKFETLSKTPARPGDKPDGDKTPVNPVKVDMVDGMRKALAQMKLSGE